MKLGISSYSYTWAIGVKGSEPPRPWGFSDLVQRANKLGIRLIQVADNLPFHEMTDEYPDACAREANIRGISLEAGARGLTDGSLEKYIGIARRIKSPLIRFVIDGPGYRPDLDTIHGMIKNTVPELEQNKIVLALENYERLRAREFAEIVEKAGSQFVGICLDSVNSMGAGEGIESVVDILGPLTLNLHIKEFTIKRIHHMMGFQVEGLPAGKGMLNIPWLLDKVSDRCQSAIIEQWVPPEKEIGQTAEKEAAWADESVNYLRKYIKN